jgi:hypothetical protein
MIFHAFFIRPEAGESTRGYLHGGIFIDFIGQKPVPVFRLLAFDTLILLVDIVMLALIIERVKTVGSKGLASSVASGSATTNANANANADTDTTQSGQQDHDSEERGVRSSEDDGDTNDSRADENAHTNTSPVPEIDDDVQDERTTLLADPGEGGTGPIPRGGHPLDSYATGQAVIMDMGFFTTIRDQWKHSTTPVRRGDGRYAPSPQAATFLRERFGLQVGADGRIVRIGQ